MEAHIEQQESMFAEPAELEAPDYAEEFVESAPELSSPELSSPELPSEEESEAIFAGDEPADPTGPAESGEHLESGEHVESGEGDQPAEPPSAMEQPATAPAPNSPAELTPLSADDFSALEDRVLRAVSLVRTERQARIAAEERAAELKAQLETQAPLLEQLQHETESLRLEREQVRQRVERLLAQLDALEL